MEEGTRLVVTVYTHFFEGDGVTPARAAQGSFSLIDDKFSVPPGTLSDLPFGRRVPSDAHEGMITHNDDAEEWVRNLPKISNSVVSYEVEEVPVQVERPPIARAPRRVMALARHWI